MLFARAPLCAGPVSIACGNTGPAGAPETLVIPNATVGSLTVYVVVKAFGVLDPGELNITFTAL